MSIRPHTIKLKDPSAKLNYTFDWTAWLGTATIASASMSITGSDAVLTYDNVVVDPTAKMVTARLLAGTPGVTYRVTCHIVTNESPVQEDDRYIEIRVVDQ